MRSSPFEKRGWILERNNDETEEDRYYWNDGRLDHNGDKECILVCWLDASGVTPDSADEVPEELAIEQPKVASPNRIDGGGDSDVARVLVPNKFSHFFSSNCKTC